MKNKLVWGMLILLVINIAAMGYLFSRFIMAEKHAARNFDVVDERVDELSDALSEMNEEVEELSEDISEMSIYPVYIDQTETEETLWIEIWLDEDHYVHRTGVDDDTASIAWVVLYNGEEVLERNALNETEYKYYRSDPGVYTIYLESFVDGSYKAISNIVSYTIE